MDKILVTGATGFVGYHVAKKLVDQKWGEVVCLARPESRQKYVRELPVRIVHGDLRDKKSLEDALRGCSLLFHVAADYRLWSKNPDELVQSNVRGTENIIEAALQSGVKRIVYTSSVSAVGRPEPEDHDCMGLAREERLLWEQKTNGNETLDPTEKQQIGPYKKSKYQAELAARRFAGNGAPVVIVNPSTPVGSHDAKPTPTGKMILDFLNRKMPAYLDTGLNFIDVEDAAEGHLLAAQKGKIGERYILGNQNLMLKEMLDVLEKITGLPSPKIKIPYFVAYLSGWFSTAAAEITGRPPAIPLDGVKMAGELMFYDASKAVKELNLPQNPIEDALAKAVRFFKTQGYVRT